MYTAKIFEESLRLVCSKGKPLQKLSDILFILLSFLSEVQEEKVMKG